MHHYYPSANIFKHYIFTKARSHATCRLTFVRRVENRSSDFIKNNPRGANFYMSKFFYITKPEELGVSKNNQKNCPEK